MARGESPFNPLTVTGLNGLTVWVTPNDSTIYTKCPFVPKTAS